MYSSSRQKLGDELSALHKLGIPAIFEEAPPLPISTAGAVGIPGQAQFHPLKLAKHLAKELTIYENSGVMELIGIYYHNRATKPYADLRRGHKN